MPAETSSKHIPLFDRRIGTWHIQLTRAAQATQEMSQVYDRRADTWSERLAWLGIPAAYQSLWLSLAGQVQSLPTQAALRVLDCGIGDGAFSAAFASVWSGTLDLHGVDISPMMLRAARRNLQTIGVSPTLWLADGRDLPFDDSAFNLVTSAHMLEHLETPLEAISEIFRVLKPGGLFVAALTRQSWLGRCIQLMWRTRVYTGTDAFALFNCCGFEKFVLHPLPAHRLSEALSLICIGRKPLSCCADVSSSTIRILS